MNQQIIMILLLKGKNKLLLRMTEYHFNKIKGLLGDLDDK